MSAKKADGKTFSEPILNHTKNWFANQSINLDVCWALSRHELCLDNEHRLKMFAWMPNFNPVKRFVVHARILKMYTTTTKTVCLWHFLPLSFRLIFFLLWMQLYGHFVRMWLDWPRTLKIQKIFLRQCKRQKFWNDAKCGFIKSHWWTIDDHGNSTFEQC